MTIRNARCKGKDFSCMFISILCMFRVRQSSTQSDINQVSHWYNNSPDDEHMAARNMYRIEINIQKNCASSWLFTRIIFMSNIIPLYAWKVTVLEVKMKCAAVATASHCQTDNLQFNVYWTVHHCNSWRMKDQLDVTCYFISFLMCSTCFGH